MTRFLEKFGVRQRRQSIFVFKGLWSFYYQEEGEDQVLFGFQMKFNKCFCLGGSNWATREMDSGDTGVWQDQEADLLGYQLVFYRISEEYVYESSRLRL